MRTDEAPSSAVRLGVLDDAEAIAVVDEQVMGFARAGAARRKDHVPS
ncbi:hypothetical protein [Promicromonospora sp. NPDC023987]